MSQKTGIVVTGIDGKILSIFKDSRENDYEFYIFDDIGEFDAQYQGGLKAPLFKPNANEVNGLNRFFNVPKDEDISDSIKKLIREEVKKAVEAEMNKFFRDLNSKFSGRGYY